MMYLDNKFRVTKPYSGSSKFPFWHNIKLGDIITIKMQLKGVGRGRTLYATQLIIENKDDKFIDSINGMLNYLEKMEIEQI